ncbi:hypothetical protein [Agrobacterium sp. lyk4-40-TYG-31]|uniref:hypothetical protein n=1 Tax=Agrobacterium sp. lyk4-40-TYG-31 TaxID=3040276 RepID=UPI00254ACB12|nr:hypothetical protein [Agrobacterium sp. lyk4-40-TYG-31]
MTTLTSRVSSSQREKNFKLDEDDEVFPITSKRELLIHNERTKHRASWCNTLASNVLVAGGIAPTTAALLSVHITPWIIIFACGFFAGAVIIKGYGIEILKELRSDDDIRISVDV